jgi:hypothetical protein
MGLHSGKIIDLDSVAFNREDSRLGALRNATLRMYSVSLYFCCSDSCRGMLEEY